MNHPSKNAQRIAQLLKDDVVAASLVKDFIPPAMLRDLLELPSRSVIYLDHKDVSQALRHFASDEVRDYALCLTCQKVGFWRMVYAKLKWMFYIEPN